jgi:hypothetical protein
MAKLTIVLNQLWVYHLWLNLLRKNNNMLKINIANLIMPIITMVKIFIISKLLMAKLTIIRLNMAKKMME